MLNLKAIKGKEKGFCEFLNWGIPIDNGIVLNKDGSLMAGFRYRGRDHGSSTVGELIKASVQVSTAFARLGGGWSVWVDASKVETNSYPRPEQSFFPDPISRMVDDERRQQFEAEGAHFETLTTIVLQYTPPLKAKRRFIDLMYTDESGTYKSDGDDILAGFKLVVDDIEDILKSELYIWRMTSERLYDDLNREYYCDELVDHINFVVTSERASLVLKPGNYIDATVGGGEVEIGDIVKIADRYYAVLHLSGLPEMSNPNILKMIDDMTFPLRWSTRYIGLDPREANKVILTIEKKWKQKSRGFFAQLFGQRGRINEDAESMYLQASQAKAKSVSGTVGTGYFTTVVVIPADTPEEAVSNARIVRQAIIDRGFMAELESLNTIQALIGSWPGHAVYNVRKPPLHSDNLSDLLPLSSVWTGKATCPCPEPFYPRGSPALMHAATTGATPFRINLHHHDVGHTLIFGPTGMGKTTLLCMLILQALRYKNMRIWAFDYKRGLLTTVKACGGHHYDIVGDDGGMQFCPLGSMRTKADLIWSSEWIADCFELQKGTKPTNRNRDAIYQTLLAMLSGPDRTLTHFVGLCQDTEVCDAMNYYTLNGPLGHILDAKQDSIDLRNIMAFEMEDLLAMKPEAALPVLLYLFRQFELRLNGDPTYLILDEAWIVLGHPVFRPKVREWLKVLRSKNCLVIMATQSLSDAVNCGILDVLIENCPTKFALANDQAFIEGSKEHPGPKDFYRAFGLNDTQIGIIARATPKREYYVFTPEGRRLIDLGLGPIALAFAGATGKIDVARVRELERVFGDDWPMRWLDEKLSKDKKPLKPLELIAA